MELQQLRYVIAVAEETNFTRAAKRCFVVQSALSHQIKALESELGTDLFARTSRRVDLTPAGAAFLPHARRALESAELAAQEAVAAHGIVNGALRIGMIPTVSAVNVPILLRRFHESFPQVNTSLSVRASDDIVESVANGALDVGVIGMPRGRAPKGVESAHLTTERLAAIVHAGHRLAHRESVDLAELTEEVFADFATGGAGREQSDVVFVSAGIERNVRFEADTPESLLGLVREGLAVCLLSPEAISDSTGVRAIAVNGGPERTQYLVWSRFNPSPAARAFVDFVEEPQT